jgi:hypothetical protein
VRAQPQQAAVRPVQAPQAPPVRPQQPQQPQQQRTTTDSILDMIER